MSPSKKYSFDTMRSDELFWNGNEQWWRSQSFFFQSAYLGMYLHNTYVRQYIRYAGQLGDEAAITIFENRTYSQRLIPESFFR